METEAMEFAAQHDLAQAWLHNGYAVLDLATRAGEEVWEALYGAL